MINKELKVGDYIFQANGKLARITKVNKATYSCQVITSAYENSTVNFNGITKNDYWGEHAEWFECDDAQAKALELAFNKYKIANSCEDILEENKNLVAKAKYFLNQIKDIEEQEVEENE